MPIRLLLPSDVTTYQALRLRGLREEPTAFASSYEEEQGQLLSKVATGLAEDPDQFMLGAYSADQLVGLTGVYRETPIKLAHKAFIWGVYVAPEFRKQGLGRSLIEDALARAFSVPAIRRVNLGVNAANVAAITLYEAAGFKKFGFEPGYMIVDGVPQHEVHMVCVRPTP